LLDAHVVNDEQVALDVALHGAVVRGVYAVIFEIIQDIKDGSVEDDFALLDELISNGLCDVTLGEIKDTHSVGAPTSAERRNIYTRLIHNKRPL
jgi:hypothetical protein